MRKRRRRTSGVSLGTIATLTLLGLVVAGCVYLFPKLVGNIELRVDPQTVSVAIDSSLRSLRGQSTAQQSASPGATPATAPPLDIAAYETPTPSPTPVVTRSLTLTAAGSINIDTKIQKACTGADGYTFGPLFEQLSAQFNGDAGLATLENLVIANEKLTNVNMPSDALTAIRSCGINVLCTGFPSAFNSGVAGLSATLDAITQSGMTPYGTYVSQESRNHVTTMQVSDTMIALLSFQGELSSSSKKNTSQEEQAYMIAPLTLPEIAEEITAARATGAQIVIVSLCWGKEGANAPTDSQRELAQGIAEAGADIILGTHSSALQTVEMLVSARSDGTIRRTLCAYSLGDLLSSDRTDRECISGVLLHIGMTYDLAKDSLTFDTLTYTPTYVWRGKLDGKTTYRVLVSNVSPPDYVGEDQRQVMERSLALVRDRLTDSAVKEAP